LSIKIFLKAAAFCLSNHPFENLNNLHKIDRQKGLLLLKEHASLKLSVCIDEIQPAPAFVTTIIYFTMSVELRVPFWSTSFRNLQPMNERQECLTSE